MQFFRFTAFFLVISLNLQGQGRDYQGPDDPAGDPSAERSGYMTGNRVLIFFKNTTGGRYSKEGKLDLVESDGKYVRNHRCLRSGQ